MNKYMKIAQQIATDAHMKEFRRLPYEMQDRARSLPEDGIIEAALPNDPVRLETFAHEAGHLATSPPIRYTASSIKQEFEATKWGLSAIRRHGGTVTPEMQEDARYALSTYTAEPDDTRDGKDAPEAYAYVNQEIDL